MRGFHDKAKVTLLAVLCLGVGGMSSSVAYDGTVCKAPGDCWEPKPGYPEKVAGSKYDPKHNPQEVNKQSDSILGMEERNRRRVEYFKKTGQFIYDVSKIPSL
jgi:methanol dehydrogenase (cytochrome c) subunit 2